MLPSQCGPDGKPAAKDASPEEPPTKKHRKKDKGEDKEAWKFLVGDSLVDDVVVHKTWPDFSSHEEDLFKTFLLRSRIGMCLDSLAAVVGHYTADDLMVASRRSSKGVWITEVWTLRDFKPKEIRIAPGDHPNEGVSLDLWKLLAGGPPIAWCWKVPHWVLYRAGWQGKVLDAPGGCVWGGGREERKPLLVHPEDPGQT